MLKGFSISSITQDAQFLIEDASLQTAPLVKLRMSQLRNTSAGAADSGRMVLASPEYQPTVVLSCQGPKPSPSFLREKAAAFKRDPEFLQAFWSHIFVAIPSSVAPGFDISNDTHAILEELQCSRVSILTSADEGPIPEGPYHSQDGKLHKCWRLWPDCYEAFQLPVVQLSSSKFIGITVMHDGKMMVPVPSRLHSFKSEDKPLNGLRFTLKDIIDLEGIKTTAQSRAYAKTYDSAKATAPSVERLLQLGAVVIGKTKGTQFASSDQPTGDWVDYHCPWNPRGDGYLSPRGSSTGPSVAVAGYDWVDFSVGTDSKFHFPMYRFCVSQIM
jgi:hypothetical protein